MNQAKYRYEIQFDFWRDGIGNGDSQLGVLYFFDNSKTKTESLSKAKKHWESQLTSCGWRKNAELIAIVPISSAKTPPKVVEQKEEPKPKPTRRRTTTTRKKK